MIQLTTENVDDESLATLTYTRQVHVNAHTHTANSRLHTHTHTHTPEYSGAQSSTDSVRHRRRIREWARGSGASLYTEGVDSGFIRRCINIQVAYRNVHTVDQTTPHNSKDEYDEYSDDWLHGDYAIQAELDPIDVSLVKLPLNETTRNLRPKNIYHLHDDSFLPSVRGVTIKMTTIFLMKTISFSVSGVYEIKIDSNSTRFTRFQNSF